jgi:hypothetical protein
VQGPILLYLVPGAILSAFRWRCNCVRDRTGSFVRTHEIILANVCYILCKRLGSTGGVLRGSTRAML